MISAQVRDIILLKLLPVKDSTISNWIQKQQEMFNPPCLLIEEKWRTGTHLNRGRRVTTILISILWESPQAWYEWVSIEFPQWTQLLFYPSDIQRDCLVTVISVTAIHSSLFSVCFHKVFSSCRKAGFAFTSWAEFPLAALSNFTWRSWAHRDKGYLTLQDAFFIQKVQIGA